MAEHSRKSARSLRHERTDHERPRDERARHRSRSREPGDRKRKSRDDADREREEPRSKRHTSEARSQSPLSRRDRERERDRHATRQKSPPKGPRAAGAPPRERSRDRSTRERIGDRSSRPNGTAIATNGVKPRKDDSRRGRDVQMSNGAVHEDEDDEAAMLRLMGFGTFRTTKNTKVPGNHKNYGVRKEKKTEYRQYMNRQGGFNRPLSPGR